MKPFLTAASACAVVAVVLASSARAADRLTVFAASSLTTVLPAIDAAPRYSFGGSGTLEEQIRRGAPADLFASASAENTQRLYTDGLVGRPVAFASNRLALIVPRGNPAGIRSVGDLRTKKAKLVVAAETVPVGAYTRKALARLGLAAVLESAVSEEPDVRSVVGKVALGEADAGFVYLTDARSVASRVRVIALPPRAQPVVRYEIAVVGSSPSKARARAWIDRLLSARGQAALRAAGFLPAPS